MRLLSNKRAEFSLFGITFGKPTERSLGKELQREETVLALLMKKYPRYRIDLARINTEYLKVLKFTKSRSSGFLKVSNSKRHNQINNVLAAIEVFRSKYPGRGLPAPISKGLIDLHIEMTRALEMWH